MSNYDAKLVDTVACHAQVNTQTPTIVTWVKTHLTYEHLFGQFCSDAAVDVLTNVLIFVTSSI